MRAKAPAGRVYSSESCLDYGMPGHPESPERVRRSLARLKELGYEILAPQPASEGDVLRIHTPEHLQAVRDDTFFDPDTPCFPNIYGIALLSAGGALAAAASALRGTPAFSLLRPPGHHAGRLLGVGGFCYFNNLAAAVASALEHKVRVAILDIDVHHGNGTQEIFSGRPDVLFCSIHQIPLYPGSGTSSDQNCLNFPIPPGAGEADYLKTLDRALEAVQGFKPQLLAVSAGFDTYRKDPIANLALDLPAYRKIGEAVARLKLPRFGVLEGGYSEDLPQCVAQFLGGFFNGGK